MYTENERKMIYFTKGKPGEIRGRKAQRSTVTQVTRIARLLKNAIVAVTGSLENDQARSFWKSAPSNLLYR